MHEILVNKLCALLSRSELRDLIDVRTLALAGADLELALSDAPRKDGGFSPLTLAWVLDHLDVESLARSLSVPSSETSELLRFRAELVDRLVGARLEC